MSKWIRLVAGAIGKISVELQWRRIDWLWWLIYGGEKERWNENWSKYPILFNSENESCINYRR